MSEHIITHPGIIKSINKKTAEVSIIVNSGCASCEVKSSCSISEAKEKIIDVSLSPNDHFVEGQQVMVEMKQSMGTWAILLGYLFPFLVVLLALIVFTMLGINEGLSALLSLAILIPYYTILYLVKNSLQKKFTYSMQAS